MKLLQRAGLMLFIFSLLILSSAYVNAQCTPDTTGFNGANFTPSDSLDCIERGVPYSDAVSLYFDQVIVSGFTATVDTITITSITGLPTGINYTCNNPGCVYVNQEMGCIVLSGTTNDPAGTYTVTINAVAVVTIAGLGQSTQSAPLSYDVVVIEQGAVCPNGFVPPPLLVDAGNDTIVCSGNPVTLTANASGGTPPYTYAWSTGQTTSTITENPLSLTNFVVTVTDTSNNITLDTVVVTPTFNSPPCPPSVLTILMPNDTNICLGESVSLEVQAFSGSGNYTYLWSNNSSSPTIFETPASTTTYNVTVEDGNDTVVGSVTVTVITTQPPCGTAPLELTVSNDTIICDGETVTLNAFATGGTGVYDYVWSSGTLSQTTTETPGASTTYGITVTDGNDTVVDSVVVTLTLSNPPCVPPTPVCVPNPIFTQPGFYPPDTSLPCIEQGVYYEQTIQFVNFISIDGNAVGFPGITILVDSFRLDSIPNLPAGLSYSCTPPSCTFGTGANGCIIIYGTTNDPVNLVALDIYGTLFARVGPTPLTVQVDPGTLSSAGLSYSLRIITPGGFCPNTVPAFAVNGSGPATICSGESTALSAFASGGTGLYSYSWSTGDTTSSIIVSPTSATTYTVTVDDGNTNQTASMAVTVVPSPTANAGIDDTICAGDIAFLTATGGAAYEWDNGSSSASNPVTPSITTNYTVTVTDGNGCTAEDDVNVVVLPAVVASVSITSNPSPACAGQAVTFTATPVNGGSSPTYQWRLNGSTVGGSGNTYSSSTLSAGDVVLCQLTPDEECFTPATIISNSIVVSGCGVNLAVVTTGDQTICEGEAAQLSAVASGGSGTYTYSWTPTTGLNDANIANPTASPATTTIYTITVDDGSTTETATVTVTVNPAPTADAGADVTICTGGSASLNATGGDTYSWAPPTGLSDANIANPVATPGITTDYVVTVSTAAGCTATDSVTVNVSTSASASVTIEASEDTICAGEAITFTALPVNGGTPTYAWTINGSAAGSGNASETFTLAVGDIVQVDMTSSLGCVTTATVSSNTFTAVDCTVGFDENELERNITVYPNPNTGTFYLQVAAAVSENLQVEVYNMQGQLVNTRTVTHTGTQQEVFNLSDLNKGVYFLTIRTADEVAIKKVVLQ